MAGADKPKGGKSKQIQQSKAAARKGGKQVHKKWSTSSDKGQKGSVAVLLDASNHDKLMAAIPAMRVITISSVADRLSCNLSLARRAIRSLLEKGTIKPVTMHSKFYLCTRLPPKEGEKAPVEEEKPAKPEKKQKK